MKRNAPISLRIDPEFEKRLEECARLTKIPKYKLALMALEAVVEATEEYGYQLVVPVKFVPVNVPSRSVPIDEEPLAALRHPESIAEDRPHEPIVESGDTEHTIKKIGNVNYVPKRKPRKK